MDLSANRLQRPPKTFPKYEGQQIVAISEDVFQVESSQNVDNYMVNIATNICTCHEGCTGKMCKHMFYVLSRQPDADRHYHLNDSRELMYLVACGHQAPDGWLANLHGGSSDAIQRSTGQPAETSNTVQTNLDTAATSIDTPEFEYKRDVKEFHDLLDKNIFGPGKGNEVEILPTLRSAIESLKRIATTNSGVSALRTFGKYSGGGASSAKKLKLSSIPVQSTALGRRRKVLRGSAPGEPGRPRKSALLRDNLHDYTMPSRRLNAPARHNLGECVRKNIALGKTHSKK